MRVVIICPSNARYYKDIFRRFLHSSGFILRQSGQKNLAVIRQIALNLLKQEKMAKVGTQTKRLMAGWDHAYLAKLLEGSKMFKFWPDCRDRS